MKARTELESLPVGKRTEAAGPEGKELVAVERGPNGVAIVRLGAPKLNALSTVVLGRLAEIARDLTLNPPGAVVVWGGERAFSVGADISEFGGPDQARVVAAAFRDALDAVAAIPRATIAAITGYALGGGLELALACDFRVAADTATLGQPEVSLGIIPGGGATQRLPRLVGVSKAKDIIFGGKQLRAEQALRIGLVDRVFSPDRVLYEATVWAEELARGATAAHGLAKRAIDGGLDQALGTGLDLEAECFAKVFATADAKIGVDSFLEHRRPGRASFLGR